MNTQNKFSHFESVERPSQIGGMNTSSFVARKLGAESLHKGIFGAKMKIDNIVSTDFIEALIKQHNLKLASSEYGTTYSLEYEVMLYICDEFALSVTEKNPIQKGSEKYTVCTSLYAKDRAVFEKIRKELVKNFSCPQKESSIKVLSSSYGEVITREVKTPEWKDIEIKNCYYNTSFQKFNKKMSGFMKDRSNSALCLLFGDVGTGKTTYLRKFMSDHPENDFIYVPVSMVGSISSPTFMDFLAENENVVLILEDAEKVVAQRGSGQSDECAVSNLLQMTDGLLNDVFKTRVIITFNCEIERIDEALTRNGRLFASYEFKNLTKSRAKDLMKKLGKDPSKITKDTSLADIFNDEETGLAKKTKKQLGFKK